MSNMTICQFDPDHGGIKKNIDISIKVKLLFLVDDTKVKDVVKVENNSFKC
jgi:hypothetical protein